jgi:peptidoglycan hydrolase-like protein with peptidoglycan-binding domain
VVSSDEAGNISVSPDETFTTSALPVIAPIIPSDINAPIISNITDASIGSTNATIAWMTNESAVSTFDYGTTTAYGSTATLSASALLLHDGTLTGLTPGTTYYYCIHAADLAGNIGSSCGQFTTGAGQVISDTSAPTVSLVTVVPLASTTATISWTTDELANSYVQYGTSASYGSQTPLSSLELSGTTNLSNLTPDTTYHFRIVSSDSSGNIGHSSDEIFTTDALAVIVVQSPSVITTPVVISSVIADSVSQTDAVITWTTNIPSDSKVEYGDQMEFDQNVSDPTQTTLHSVTLTGLDSNTNYDFRVVSTPIGGVAVTSNVYDFNTLAVPVVVDPAANILSVSASSTNTTNESISWTTDEGTIGSIEYGLDTTYGNTASSTQSSLQTSDELTLSSLLPATTYHFRVKAVDAADNITYSEDHTFTTTGTLVVNPVENISVGSGGGAACSIDCNGNAGTFSPSVPTPDVITVSGVDSQVVFTLNNPQTPDFAGTIIVRDSGTYPNLETNGQVIYEGNSQTFTDTNVQNGTTYYYSVYSYNGSGGYSNPLHVSTAPQPGIIQVQLNENPILQPALSGDHFTTDLKFGDQSLEVEHLQQILNTVNVHPSGLTTGYFGPLTQAALKTFQAKYNLPQTGVADAATRTVLDSISQSWMVAGAPNAIANLQTDLKYGDSGQSVAALQEFLAYEGSYEEGIISSTYGPLTKESVADFQQKHGVTPVSGYVGYKTRHTMQTVLGL